MRTPRPRTAVLAAIALAILCGVGAIVVLNAGRWLETQDPPRSADAIVVLGGGYFRPLYAGELYRKGLAPRVIISRPRPDPATAPYAALGITLVPQDELYREVLVAMGVPGERIRTVDGTAISTFDEANLVRRALDASVRSLLVVTSPYHVRRARMIFTDVLAGSGVQIAVAGVPEEQIPRRWWASQDSAREVLLEYAKLAFYLAGGRFRDASGGGAAR